MSPSVLSVPIVHASCVSSSWQTIVWFENLGGDVNNLFRTMPHIIVAVTTQSSTNNVLFVGLAALRPATTQQGSLNLVVSALNQVSYFVPRVRVVHVSACTWGSRVSMFDGHESCDLSRLVGLWSLYCIIVCTHFY